MQEMILVVVEQSVTMDTTQNNNSIIQVSPVLTYARTILQLQISSIFHINCFFVCIIIIILNSVIGTLYSTNINLLKNSLAVKKRCGPV